MTPSLLQRAKEAVTGKPDPSDEEFFMLCDVARLGSLEQSRKALAQLKALGCEVKVGEDRHVQVHLDGGRIEKHFRVPEAEAE